MKMRCEEIMKTDVECLEATDTIQEAARCMADENIGFLPVCDPDSKVLGTLTDRDITVRVVAKGRSLKSKVGDFMTRNVVSCKASDDLARAEELLARHKVSRIMCLDDDGKLVGVISLSDLAQIDREKIGETLAEVTERETTPPSIH